MCTGDPAIKMGNDPLVCRKFQSKSLKCPGIAFALKEVLKALTLGREETSP